MKWRRWLLALAIACAALAAVGGASTTDVEGCEADHVATPDADVQVANQTYAATDEVEVRLCESLGGVYAGSYTRTVIEPEAFPVTHGNVTVQPGERYTGAYVLLDDEGPIDPRTYLHELGHATSYRHEDGGALMGLAEYDTTRCRHSEKVRHIAKRWDTVTIDRSGPCHVAETPMGTVPETETGGQIEALARYLLGDWLRE